MKQAREKRAPHVSGVVQRQCSCATKGACPKCGGRDARPEGGERLDAATRGFMERRFDHDFSHVRIHADGRAAQSAAGLNALAYTAGAHIVFGAGRFAPHSAGGRKLLAHELAHVVQQDRHPAAAQSLAAKSMSEPSDAAEREADGAAERISGNEPITVRRSPAAPLQRLSTGAGVAIGAVIGGSLLTAGLVSWKMGLFDGKSSGDDVPTLEDPKFKKVWDENIRAGAKFMAEKKPELNCQFPHQHEDNYDRENWREGQARNIAGKMGEKGYSPKQPSGDPGLAKQKVSTYDAVQNLFDGLNKWSCDCRMYSELILLYAWHKSLTPAQFNKKFADFQLAREGSPGIDRQSSPSSDGFAIDDLAFEAAPVGTKVGWENDSAGAYASWGYEHAIKTTKGATPDQDRYAAQGAGDDPKTYEYSELEVEMAMLRHDSRSPFRYRVTDAVLARLKADGVADDKLKGLDAIKGRDVTTEVEFVRQPAVKALDPETRFQVLTQARVNAVTPEIRSYIKEHIRRNKADIPK
jgi:hypothetical protein